MAYFPMYVNIEGRRALVVGGGAVALRKVRTLLDFGAKSLVVAPEILAELRELSGVRCELREFERDDLAGCALVVAATDDPKKNHEVAELAKERGIFVNAVDQIEDCTFLFPAYVKQKNLVGACSSGGNSPVMAQHLRGELERVLTEELGEQNEYLGRIRRRVQAAVPTESGRRLAFERILARLLDTGKTRLDERELDEICRLSERDSGI